MRPQRPVLRQLFRPRYGYPRACSAGLAAAAIEEKTALSASRPPTTTIISRAATPHTLPTYSTRTTTSTILAPKPQRHVHSSAFDDMSISKACCSIPPVVATGYEKKGKFVDINGFKTYVTGPEDAQKAILVIYDIFGFWDQTLQGADILSTSDKDQSYRVFVPDFFHGEPADISWYPPTDEEKKKNLSNFFATKAVARPTLDTIPSIINGAGKTFPGGWAIVGFCWGGKIASLSAASASLFKAAVQCHPAMLDPKDAESVVIPMAMLPSGGEDAKTVESYMANLSVKKHVQWFHDQVHGWMSARGDLKDDKVKKEYENGYHAVLGFLHESMNTPTTPKI